LGRVIEISHGFLVGREQAKRPILSEKNIFALNVFGKIDQDHLAFIAPEHPPKIAQERPPALADGLDVHEVQDDLGAGLTHKMTGLVPEEMLGAGIEVPDGCHVVVNASTPAFFAQADL
jgi:hypothetical protein